MIPRTYPSILEDGKTKCVVYVLPSISGLQAWKDYIPVKGVTTENTAVENTYANDGYIVMKTVDGTQKAWIDYLPVYEDASYNKAWSTDAGGYIPASGLFSVRGTLFANSEPGVWYDPSDMSTLFQDSAGTTPVTAVEQPVGLMLDKSKGLVLGSELVANGDFSNGSTGWTLQSGWSIGSGVASVNSSVAGTTGLIRTGMTVVSGKTYAVTYTILSVSGTGIRASLGGFVEATFRTTPGTYTIYVTTTTTTGLSITAGSTNTVGSIDNISVKELPGNHATQSTSTSRPVLSARYNLLTKTEQFNDAAWTKSNATITANTVVAPDGTLTADKLVEDTANAAHFVNVLAGTIGLSETRSVYAKAAGRTWLYLGIGSGASAYFDLTNGVTGVVVNGTATISNAGNGWFRCSFTATRAINANNVTTIASANGTVTYTGDGTSGVYLWGTSLVPANQASLPYQRVDTSTVYDSDATKFPPYLKFDGVDDWMVTPTITPGTDKVQVFAGVRKLSDAARGVVVELSASTGANNGTFVMDAPSDGTNKFYGFTSRGNSPRGAFSGAINAPVTNVLAGLGDISNDVVSLRLNGAQVSINTDDQDTGNYLAYPLYIGRRGGTTLPFNGQLYSLITRFGPNLPTATIEAAEKFVATKTGISLT
jgi:hypothetical protein